MSATVYLIRHAVAGRRGSWKGSDEERPLTKEGLRQAERLASSFADLALARLVSSPFTRCVQTLEPLAQAKGLAIACSDVLAEGAPAGPLLQLIRAATEPVALCTHGDVLLVTMHALVTGGVAADPLRFDKGST
jgi:8-oxo-dGTP diphosphatase